MLKNAVLLKKIKPIALALVVCSQLFSNVITLPCYAITDAQVKQRIIQESIDAYPGNCPCPYNTASNGSSCGRRSAYSRDGGYAPLCYPADVNSSMVKEWRANHR